MPPINSICVIGLGYVGLPTALTYSAAGFTVLGFDANAERVRSLNAGQTDIQETGIPELLASGLRTGKFKAFDAAQPADAYLICVPTPVTASNEPDLTAVMSAVESIRSVVKPGDLVVLESTSPVGTTRQIYEQLKRHAGAEIFAAYCPERILPGKILEELSTLDRVIGGVNPESATRARALFSKLTTGQCHETTAETAEFVKLAENSFRDVNIAFANELKNMCKLHEVDVNAVRRFANMHPRVEILQPGIGVGGHCIPIDPWFLIHGADPTKPSVIRAARLINNRQPHLVVDHVVELSKQNNYKKLAVFGLTYKADVNDFRESPAMEVLKSLADTRQFSIEAYDPFVRRGQNAESFPGTMIKDTSAIAAADLNVFLVAHREFKPVLGDFEKQGRPTLNLCNL